MKESTEKFPKATATNCYKPSLLFSRCGLCFADSKVQSRFMVSAIIINCQEDGSIIVCSSIRLKRNCTLNAYQVGYNPSTDLTV